MSNSLYRAIVDGFIAFLLVLLGIFAAGVWITVATESTVKDTVMGLIVTAMIAGVAWFLCWVRRFALSCAD